MKLARYESVEAMLRTLRPSYPVYCLRPRRLRDQAQRFLRLFPGTVLYAVKCNPHEAVLRALYGAGIRGFDTASLPEIALVNELFDEAEAYFHHPVKSRAAIQAAYEVYGVEFYSVDHLDELAKVQQETNGVPVTIMVRLKTASGYAAYDLSAKFGAEADDAVALLRRAHALGLSLGLSFHVGSQCRYPAAYEEAIKVAGEVLVRAEAPVGWLNVGGGFPAEYPHMHTPPLESFMDAIKAAVRAHIPNSVRLMCEPGRAMVADGCSLAVQVQLRKDHQLYINDGIFGSLSEVIYDESFQPPTRLIRAGQGSARNGRLAEFAMFGPTCDSNDRLPRPFTLPDDVREGDWIEIGQLGAYSNALSSNFNGFAANTYVEIEEG